MQNIESDCGNLRASGVEVVGPKAYNLAGTEVGDMKIAFITDPDGVLAELIERPAKFPATVGTTADELSSATRGSPSRAPSKLQEFWTSVRARRVCVLGGSVEFQNVTVTVPVARVGDLLSYAADLARRETDADPAGTPPVAPMSPTAIRMAYLGGKSEHWRPFIDVLVSRPDTWVGWLELCDRIGLRPPQAAGMLGAAERRCGMRPPYEKRQHGGVISFRVSSTVAAIILDTPAD